MLYLFRRQTSHNAMPIVALLLLLCLVVGSARSVDRALAAEPPAVKKSNGKKSAGKPEKSSLEDALSKIPEESLAPVLPAPPKPDPAVAKKLSADARSLEKATAEADDNKSRRRAINRGLLLVERATDADLFDIARDAIERITPVARPLDDRELSNEIRRTGRNVEDLAKAFTKVAAATKQLRQTPDDPAANLVLGKYLCYLKGDWRRGLPRLSVGSDAVAQQAATAELRKPNDSKQQQAIAELWWKVAGQLPKSQRAKVLLRSRMWYKRAVGSLAEAEQAKVQARIAAIEKRTASSAEAVLVALDSAPTVGDGKLTLAQRKRVKSLLADFRKARVSTRKRDAVARKLFALGGPAVSQLLAVVNKELRPQLKDYGQAFQKQAARMSAGNTAGPNQAEIGRLRAQVLSLKELPNLTKDMIVQQGDPAMTKLTQMLVVERAEILAQNQSLQRQRLGLLQIGRYWEACSRSILTRSRLADKQLDKSVEQGELKVPNFEQYLLGEEDMAAKLAMNMDDSAREVLAANAKLTPQIGIEEARAILACNLTRQLLGLSTLRIDLKLCDAARDHSKDMRTLGFFAHTSPVEGKTTPWDRAKNFGTSASGENIAAGQSDGAAANRAWFHSPGHHKNMLGGHRRIGMGVQGVHYTEMFGR